ncbi:GGDEF domain-containing protein (plasmid) [Deinococcus taeanensis]|uniref:GGDEF domain-containing protein n=1 Tax=Deinococcus taeanensis TaxID=2737050 RepID=UPI001CDC48CD|nr:GGDEF domain-containing protein [Deinococcus taeanensis]UBV45291.1 GGDEF domain-containing protein [Deinococcus taeanensis]
MALSTHITAPSALERLLLWVPFSSVLWGTPLYLIFFDPPAWQHLAVLVVIFVVFGLALFGPDRLRTPLRALAPHLYGALLLIIWTLGFYGLPDHPASPTGLVCTTLLAPVVYVLLFVQRPPHHARREGGTLLLSLVVSSLPHALTSVGRAGPFDGPVLPLTLLGAHSALLSILFHFAAAQRELVHQRASATQFHTLAHLDALTGLGNRRAFDDDLARLEIDVRSSGDRLSVVIIDLDGLKHINDTYGHAYGDALLLAFAEALREAFRDETHLYRFGGDEFALLVRPTRPDDAVDIQDRVRRAVTLTARRGFSQAQASAGVAEVPGDGDARTALRVSDARMYAQKQAGRTTPGQPGGPD